MYGEIWIYLGTYWEIRGCSKDVRGDMRMFRDILGNTRMSTGTWRYGDVRGNTGTSREILFKTEVFKGCMGRDEDVQGYIGNT